MVQIGILECGENRPEWVNEHGRICDAIPRFLNLAGAESADFTYKAYRAHKGELPDAADACDAWVIPGSPASVYEDKDWQKGLTDFIHKAKSVRPFIGICYGHQHLHAAFGGEVEKITPWGVGVTGYRLADNMPDWFPPVEKHMREEGVQIIASHQDQVTQIAPDTRILGGNEHCPNGISMIGDDILTIQNHPEMTTALARLIYEDNREKIGDAQTDAAKDSLDEKTDSAWLARLVTAFIKNHLKKK